MKEHRGVAFSNTEQLRNVFPGALFEHSQGDDGSLNFAQL
jgi:hypothetical protein